MPACNFRQRHHCHLRTGVKAAPASLDAGWGATPVDLATAAQGCRASCPMGCCCCCRQCCRRPNRCPPLVHCSCTCCCCCCRCCHACCCCRAQKAQEGAHVVSRPATNKMEGKRAHRRHRPEQCSSTMVSRNCALVATAVNKAQPRNPFSCQPGRACSPAHRAVPLPGGPPATVEGRGAAVAVPHAVCNLVRPPVAAGEAQRFAVHQAACRFRGTVEQQHVKCATGSTGSSAQEPARLDRQASQTVMC